MSHSRFVCRSVGFSCISFRRGRAVSGERELSEMFDRHTPERGVRYTYTPHLHSRTSTRP
eukprot:3623896-Prymnesium_polylepis.1